MLRIVCEWVEIPFFFPHFSIKRFLNYILFNAAQKSLANQLCKAFDKIFLFLEQYRIFVIYCKQNGRNKNNRKNKQKQQ